MMTPKLAQGDNNPGGLLYLFDISYPQFKLYRGGCKLEWHPEVVVLEDGVLQDRSLGSPWAAWIFPKLTRPEFRILYNYGPRVTICTLDTINETWVTLQGNWKRPRVHTGAAVSELGYWLETRWEIRQLEVLG